MSKLFSQMLGITITKEQLFLENEAKAGKKTFWNSLVDLPTEREVDKGK